MNNAFHLTIKWEKMGRKLTNRRPTAVERGLFFVFVRLYLQNMQQSVNDWREKNSGDFMLFVA